MVKAATYAREVGASMERMWENVADWEHLPWLHSSNFDGISLQDSGSWGWRATLGEGSGSSVVELVWDKPKSHYVARTLRGGMAGMEIWTKLKKLDAHVTGVDVAFHIPEMPERSAAKVGQLLVETYTTLWREDEEMMIWRENGLSVIGRSSAEIRIDLGPLDALRQKLPFLAAQGGVTAWVDECNGELIAYGAQCPHMLGPLAGADIRDGCVRCPWHGYAFDVQSGKSSDEHELCLTHYDIIPDETTGNVYLLRRND